jgi:hypothetical protein
MVQKEFYQTVNQSLSINIKELILINNVQQLIMHHHINYNDESQKCKLYVLVTKCRNEDDCMNPYYEISWNK